MKNYPLLTINKDRDKPWRIWHRTYLKEINNNVFALWDYNNYFLSDYYKFSLDIDEHDHYINADKLPYHGYFRALENNIGIYLNNIDTKYILNQGYLLVSKARNENGLHNIKNDLNYYFIQPFGYGSFYLYTYQNNQLAAFYDRYAEETYGLLYTMSIFNKYPRFILRYAGTQNLFLWTAIAYDKENSNSLICTRIGSLWTDINVMKPMNFSFIEDSDNTTVDYGEEIIVDTYNYNSIKVDDFNIAEYNEVVLEKGDLEHPWPQKIVRRMI